MVAFTLNQVAEPGASFDAVGARDCPDNIVQTRGLTGAGYVDAFSFECFAPRVRQLDEPELALGASKTFISSQLQAKAA